MQLRHWQYFHLSVNAFVSGWREQLQGLGELLFHLQKCHRNNAELALCNIREGTLGEVSTAALFEVQCFTHC